MSDKSDVELELEELSHLAPAGYYIGLHIRYVSPLVQYSTFSKEWVDHFTQNAYAMRDPNIAWGFSTEGACRWSELPIPDPFNIFDLAADFGMKFGMTVACGPLLSRSIAKFSRGDREYTDPEISRVKTVVRRLHQRTEPPDSLTSAQIEALKYVASGQRHASASAALNISESAFKARLIGARKKLSARTTAEAIQRAKGFQLI